jgi:LacI family transcriptional regulator
VDHRRFANHTGLSKVKSFKLATVRDIAQLARCSPATVSLALQGDHRVNQDTVQRVIDIAHQLNYDPPLRSKKTKPSSPTAKISFLNFLPRGNVSFYREMIKGIEEACRESKLEFSVSQVTSENDILMIGENELKVALSELCATGVRGVICGMMSVQMEKALISMAHLPMVKVMGAPNPFWPYDHITYNTPLIGKIASSYFAAKGHKRVGIISFDNYGVEDNLFQQRTDSVVEWLSREGIETDVHLITQDQTSSNEFEVLSTFLRNLRQNHGTGVFCGGDGISISVYQALYQQGCYPGKDIEVLSCNNEEILLRNLHLPPLSIDLHVLEIGRQAVRQLLWRIQNPLPTSVLTQLSPVLPIL